MSVVSDEQTSGITEAIQLYGMKGGTFLVHTPEWEQSPLLRVGGWDLFTSSKRQECIEAILAIRVHDDHRWAITACPSDHVLRQYTGDPKAYWGRQVWDLKGDEYHLAAEEWATYQDLVVDDQFGSKRAVASGQVGREKIDQNGDFIAHVVRPWLIEGAGRDAVMPHILVLDDENATTSRLARTFISPTHIHVPNPGIDLSADLCRQSKTSLFEYMRDLPYEYEREATEQGRFSGAFFDYCCTFKGSVRRTQPQADILLLFARRLLDPNRGVFACTFCLRGPGREARKVPAITAFILKVARRFGYDLNALAEPLLYGGGKRGARMGFFLFQSNGILEMDVESSATAAMDEDSCGGDVLETQNQ